MPTDTYTFVENKNKAINCNNNSNNNLDTQQQSGKAMNTAAYYPSPAL
jgi:hypothetical protein